MSIDKINQKMDEAITFINGETEKLNAKKAQRVVKRYNVNLVPAGAIMAILWGMGVIVAKGFWATLAALCIPFIGPAISVLWLIEKFAGGQ